MVTEARRSHLYENILKPDLERFCQYKEHTEGISVPEDRIDAEEFVAFLDVEHYLRFLGGEIYSTDGDRSQQLVKNLIAKDLLRCQEAMTTAQWSLYVEFASRLAPGDIVVTFNYDTVLEESLEKAGVAYRLCPSRYSDVRPGFCTIKDPDHEVAILKVHGSIDWFDLAPWEEAQEYLASFPYPIPDRHAIFKAPEIYQPTPLIDEPYPEEAGLRRVRRIQNLSKFLAEASLVIEAPLMLAPSHQKLLYVDPLKELWWGFAGVGATSKSLAVIGFSLPAHDQYAVQALYSVVRNFQHYDTGGIIKKAPLRVVDWCPTEEQRQQLRTRYRFIDWDRTSLIEGGFCSEAIDQLFSSD